MVLLSIPCIGGPDRTAGTPALNVTVQGSICNGNLGSTFSMNKKQTLREELVSRRKKLSSQELEDSAESIKSIWNKTKNNFVQKNVGFYWPVSGEISPVPIIKELLIGGSKCYLPMISDDKKNRNLTFRQFTSTEDTRKNIFNILEPIKGTEIDIKNLDVIFIPCVGLDSEGYRIGMGMGFYDTTLKKIGIDTRLIALAHDFQKVSSCFPESHDIPVHNAITPSGYLDYYSKNSE